MNQQDHINSSPLGQGTDYVCEYDPSQLYPIPRANQWQSSYDICPYQGVDIWNAYEISWLNERGLPQVAIGEFRVPADSPNIIESKSFKLYLNSFNLTRFRNTATVTELMEKDLSAAACGPVNVTLRPVDASAPLSPLAGTCMDQLDIAIEHYHPEPELLQVDNENIVSETLVSHLLKSNCPVTGQPDWASVQIRYRGGKINQEGLLAYLVSYREHGDFHEQCVEQIFTHLLQRCQPQSLAVYARYVRRGGLDINPYRATADCSENPENLRLARQ